MQNKFCYSTDMDNVVTVQQAAEQLGLAETTIRVYIEDGRIQATKFGRQWAIPEAEIQRYKRVRKSPGRPRNQPIASNESAETPDEND